MRDLVQITKGIAVVMTSVCLGLPVMAASTYVSGQIASHGSVLTSPTVKKDTASHVPASAYFSLFVNYDPSPSSHPLALRVRTESAVPASDVISLSHAGNYVLNYYSDQGWKNAYYILRVATHTASSAGAEVTAVFQP